MRQIFALVIAGSFLFIGCGGGPTDYAAEKITKRCECKKLKKDGDDDGYKACREEYKAWKKEAKAAAKAAVKDMSPDEVKEAMKESETKAKEARDACKAMLE